MWQIAAFIGFAGGRPSSSAPTARHVTSLTRRLLVGHPVCCTHETSLCADYFIILDELCADPGRRGDGRQRRGQQRPGRIGVGAGPRQAARHPQRVLSGVRWHPSALGPTSVAEVPIAGGPAADGAQPAYADHTRPIRGRHFVAGLAPSRRPSTRLAGGGATASGRRCGDIGAAGPTWWGGDRPHRQARNAQSRRASSMKRRDGRDSGAGRPVSAMAAATLTWRRRHRERDLGGQQTGIAQGATTTIPDHLTRSPRTPRC